MEPHRGMQPDKHGVPELLRGIIRQAFWEGMGNACFPRSGAKGVSEMTMEEAREALEKAAARYRAPGVTVEIVHYGPYRLTLKSRNHVGTVTYHQTMPYTEPLTPWGDE